MQGDSTRAMGYPRAGDGIDDRVQCKLSALQCRESDIDVTESDNDIRVIEQAVRNCRFDGPYSFYAFDNALPDPIRTSPALVTFANPNGSGVTGRSSALEFRFRFARLPRCVTFLTEPGTYTRSTQYGSGGRHGDGLAARPNLMADTEWTTV